MKFASVNGLAENTGRDKAMPWYECVTSIFQARQDEPLQHSPCVISASRPGQAESWRIVRDYEFAYCPPYAISGRCRDYELEVCQSWRA